MSDDGEDEDEEIEAVKDAKSEAIEVKDKQTRRVLFSSDTFYNPALRRENTYFAVPDLALTSFETQEDPETFQEAVNGPNRLER